MKVLIIDDNPEVVALARVRLKRDRLEVLSAGDGASGLETVRSERPDLLLLDVDLPDSCGFDICRELKADDELAMTPVIFLTGSGRTEDKVRGLDLGAVDYIAKPFDSVELQARVRAALRTKRMQDLLAEYARIDALTELWNRRVLTDRLTEEWERIRRAGGVLSVIMADLDHFKGVNDSRGHPAGDEVLRRTGRAIVEQCRTSDVPARYGGEEFAVLAPGADVARATKLAERCRKAIEALRVDAGDDDEPIRPTASFGVADSGGRDGPEDILEAADEALYRAKQEGRNRVEPASDEAATAA